MVAIVGSDIDYYMDFLPNFEGNPEGMRFVMGDKYGRDNITYNSYNEFDENGDSSTNQKLACTCILESFRNYHIRHLAFQFLACRV